MVGYIVQNFALEQILVQLYYCNRGVYGAKYGTGTNISTVVLM